jgi:hypothetical protein
MPFEHHLSCLQHNGETEHLGEDAVEDIFDAVMKAYRADKALEMNGGDDMDVDTPLEPLLTRKEALDAVSVVKHYTDDMKDPENQMRCLCLSAGN